MVSEYVIEYIWVISAYNYIKKNIHLATLSIYRLIRVSVGILQPVNTVKVMLSQSVTVLTLFPGQA